MTVATEPENTISPTCWDNCVKTHNDKPGVCTESVSPTGDKICDACKAAISEEQVQVVNRLTY